MARKPKTHRPDKPQSPPASPSPLPHLLPALAILAMVIVAYVPAMRAGFVWDDDDYVTANQAVQSPSGLGPIWFDLKATPQYYPLVFTTFWLEHKIWGLNPAGYHVVNILLHAAVAICLWRVLVRLRVPGAWFAAAVFAVHPVHVESVAWVTERKNVLSGVFFLLTILAYLRAIDSTLQTKQSSASWYLLALGLYVCALLSKTSTSVMPVVLLLLLWWQHRRLSLRDAGSVLPFFLLSAASALITIKVEHGYVSHQDEGGEWSFTAAERFLVAGRALCFYASKIAWPNDFVFVYPRWEISGSAPWQYLFPLAVLAVLIVLWLLRSSRTLKEPADAGIGPLVAVLYFIVAALPVLGFIDIYYMRYSLVADHFQYLPSMGLITLLSCLLIKLVFGVSSPKPDHPELSLRRRIVPAAVLTLVLAGLCAKTWTEATKFHDVETLWADTLRANPTAWIAHNNLGTTLKDKGKYEEAVRHLSEAVRLKPDHSNAHANLASALIALNRLDEAAPHLEKRIRMVPSDGQAHLNLANVLSSQGRIEAAEGHYRDAIRLLPADTIPLYNYALHLAETNRPAEAVRYLQRALQLKPGWPPAQQELARLGRNAPLTRTADDAGARGVQ